MAKKSLDLGKLKELMLEKGERIALIVVAALTVLILFAGVFGPMAPSTSPPANAGGPSWPTAITAKVDIMKKKIKDSVPDESQIPKVKKVLDPRIAFASTLAMLAPRTGVGQCYAVAARVHVNKPAPHEGDYNIEDNPEFALLYPLFNPDTDIPSERVNPVILPMRTTVDGNLREVQIDYFPAPALVYDIDFVKKQFNAVVAGDNKGVASPVVTLDPKRMVVVSMTFPIKEQLELFQNALRYPSVKQMLEKGESPRFLGLNVWRSQVGADGNETKPVPLYQYDDKEEKTMVRSEELDALFRKMKVDEDNPKQWAAYFGPNMVTPVPALATVHAGEAGYPALRLNGLPAPEEPDPATTTEPEKKGKSGFDFLGKKTTKTGTPPPKGAAGIILPKKWKELPADLQARASGNYNVFDPLASPFKKSKDAKDDPKGGNTGGGNTGVMNFQKPKAKDTEANPDQGEITRLLARFIDVDARVGKTYRYYIQVRVANPNFGRIEDVAHQDLAKDAELLSDWSFTPWVTVPGETYFYAVDQLAFPEKTESTPGKEGTDKDKVDADKTVVQIHRWLEKSGGRLIGDWAVAERLSIRRGDIIGRPRVLVEVPEWDAKRSQFELGFHAEKGNKKTPGIPVSFSFGDPPPVLVDFVGGKHDYRLGKTNIQKEDAAVEMLVLTPDGSLVVRNSRVDSDPTTDIGRFRQMHYSRWRNRVRAVRELPPASGTGNPFLKK